MKVAIIGAGIGGLCCAHELEKQGVYPVIYEKNDFIGEMHPHVGGDIKIIHRPIKDSINYYKSLGISVKPLNKIHRIIHYGPTKKAVIEGNLGYFYKRGKEKDSVKNQLYGTLKHSKVLLNHYTEYEKINKKFDHIVIATGDERVAKQLGCWSEWLSTYVKGAVVLGEFDPHALLVWINRDYCKHGYVYLTPFSKHKACLICIIPDVDEQQAEWYWNAFLNQENIQYEIIEEFKLPHTTGYVYPHHTNGLYFVGNAAGSIDPFLGFGQMNSITMGVMAARSIVYKKSYEKLIQKRVEQNLRMYEFRQAYNQLSNKGYDGIIGTIGTFGIQQLLYHTSLNVVKYGSELLKIINSNKYS